MKEKPDSIIIIGTLAILLGLWFIIFDAIKELYPLFTSFPPKGAVNATDYNSAIKVIGTVLSVNSIKNILLIIGGIGLLSLKKWSSFLLGAVSIYYLSISFIIPLIGYVISAEEGIIIIPPTPLFFIIFLWPLFSKRIKNLLS